MHGQSHALSMHQAPHLHASSLGGENGSGGRSGFSIQSSFLSPNSIPGAVPPMRPLGLLSDDGRPSRLSPTNDISSKTFLERSLKNMANAAAAAASTKADTKCK